MRAGLPLLIVVLFGLSATAYAQAPPRDAYGGAGDVVDQVAQGVAGEEAAGAGPPAAGVLGVTEEAAPADRDAGPAPAGVTGRGGEPGALPFTGLDLALMFAGGALLLGMGLGVRRLSRPLA